MRALLYESLFVFLTMIASSLSFILPIIDFAWKKRIFKVCLRISCVFFAMLCLIGTFILVTETAFFLGGGMRNHQVTIAEKTIKYTDSLRRERYNYGKPIKPFYIVVLEGENGKKYWGSQELLSENINRADVYYLPVSRYILKIKNSENNQMCYTSTEDTIETEWVFLTVAVGILSVVCMSEVIRTVRKRSRKTHGNKE